jgi:hypothetical protein
MVVQRGCQANSVEQMPLFSTTYKIRPCTINAASQPSHLRPKVVNRIDSASYAWYVAQSLRFKVIMAASSGRSTNLSG